MFDKFVLIFKGGFAAEVISKHGNLFLKGKMFGNKSSELELKLLQFGNEVPKNGVNQASLMAIITTGNCIEQRATVELDSKSVKTSKIKFAAKAINVH